MPVSLVLFVIAAICFLALAVPIAVGVGHLLYWGLTFLAAGKVCEKTRLG